MHRKIIFTWHIKVPVMLFGLLLHVAAHAQVNVPVVLNFRNTSQYDITMTLSPGSGCPAKGFTPTVKIPHHEAAAPQNGTLITCPAGTAQLKWNVKYYYSYFRGGFFPSLAFEQNWTYSLARINTIGGAIGTFSDETVQSKDGRKWGYIQVRSICGRDKLFCRGTPIKSTTIDLHVTAAILGGNAAFSNCSTYRSQLDCRGMR